jgi:hypothetical protein
LLESVLADQSIRTLCVLDPRLTVLGPEVLSGTVCEAFQRLDVLTLLIAPGEPPSVTGQSQGPVRSFVGPASLLRQTSLGDSELVPETLCFEAIRCIMSVPRNPAVGVVARQCPAPVDDLPSWSPGGTSPTDRIPAGIVMAHRGSIDHIGVALAALKFADPAPTAIRVGLDVDELLGYGHLIQEHPEAEFYECSHPPAGPYVIRQHLASSTTERFIVFHDSDDLSTIDRLHWLHAEYERNGPSVVGSHELRYDEEDREIRACRFPLDVTAALQLEPRHPQLHPTTMIATADFQRLGGFSTDCIFGNDTQLLLRAFFQMKLRNVDRFLYIRRDRPDSLTNARETGMENPMRIASNLSWRADFESIKAGLLRLEDSSLMPIAGSGPWQLRRLRRDEKP